MAKTYEIITTEITEKIVPKVRAVDHQMIEQDILDYAKEVKDSIPTDMVKSKVINFTSAWATGQNYNIAHELPEGFEIIGMQAMFVAKNAVNGFTVGEATTVMNGWSAADSGRTPSQGITLRAIPGGTNINLRFANLIMLPADYSASSTNFSVRIVILYT